MNLPLKLALIIALAASTAAADTVVFQGDSELGGPKIEVLREHDKGVDVKVERGVATIPWQRISRISIDYESHLACMRADGRDTPRDLHAFVTLLTRHDMFHEAVCTCALILGNDKVAENILLDIADLMEKQQEWALAKKACEMLLRANPRREGILKRIEEITKNINNPPKAPTPRPVTQPPPRPVKEPAKDPVKDPMPERDPATLAEGLETKDGWVAEPWGNKAQVSTVEHGMKVKNKVLGVTYKGTGKDKAAVRLDGTWNLTRNEALVFDVWSSGTQSISLSVAFNMLPDWVFFESTIKTIEPNQWTTVRIDLNTERFKSEATGWRNTGNLKNRDNVKQLILLIYNAAEEGIIYLDNIRLIPQPATPPA